MIAAYRAPLLRTSTGARPAGPHLPRRRGGASLRLARRRHRAARRCCRRSRSSSAWRARPLRPAGFTRGPRRPSRSAILLLTGLIVGWLVARLARRRRPRGQRAAEAEQLRDRLGRRVDLLEAASRCARALGSSLDIDEAFGAFIRELRGLVPFDRTAIVLAEGGVAHVMATAGAASTTSSRRAATGRSQARSWNTCCAARRSTARTWRDALPEEGELVRLGLHCRVVAPLLAGARAIGMISVVREEPRRVHAGGGRAALAPRTLRRDRRRRTSAPTTQSARPSRSCAASRRCARTSSRSSRTSFAARWRR